MTTLEQMAATIAAGATAEQYAGQTMNAIKDYSVTMAVLIRKECAKHEQAQAKPEPNEGVAEASKQANAVVDMKRERELFEEWYRQRYTEPGLFDAWLDAKASMAKPEPFDEEKVRLEFESGYKYDWPKQRSGSGYRDYDIGLEWRGYLRRAKEQAGVQS